MTLSHGEEPRALAFAADCGAIEHGNAMTKNPKGVPMGSTSIPASIEMSPKIAIEANFLTRAIPPGTRVYLPDIGTENDTVLVAAAKRVQELGFRAVPHVAARRLTTRRALEDRIKTLVELSGVRDVLVIGGERDRPAGEFASAIEVLETGIFDRYGIRELGVAGHPEPGHGHPEEVALNALRLKQSIGERTDADVRIVTQFGFDGEGFASWANALAGQGIDLPVHIGVAGPAKVTTLVRYAALCGVGNSLEFLRKRSSSLAALALNHSPEDVVGPIEKQWQRLSHSPIKQIHVFAFGGIERAADWLRGRGSWSEIEGDW